MIMFVENWCWPSVWQARSALAYKKHVKLCETRKKHLLSYPPNMWHQWAQESEIGQVWHWTIPFCGTEWFEIKDLASDSIVIPTCPYYVNLGFLSQNWLGRLNPITFWHVCTRLEGFHGFPLKKKSPRSMATARPRCDAAFVHRFLHRRGAVARRRLGLCGSQTLSSMAPRGEKWCNGWGYHAGVGIIVFIVHIKLTSLNFCGYDLIWLNLWQIPLQWDTLNQPQTTLSETNQLPSCLFVTLIFAGHGLG